MLFSFRTGQNRANLWRLSSARRRRFCWSDWSAESVGALEPRQLLSGFSGSVRAAEVHVATRVRSNMGRTLALPDASSTCRPDSSRVGPIRS
jgi:hypothetical protein